jgi:hypothetical protein
VQIKHRKHCDTFRAKRGDLPVTSIWKSCSPR